MPSQTSFSYAVVRIVPRVEREEFLNAGVVLFSPERKFLAARIDPERTRLQLLWPELDLEEISAQLDAISLICAGSPKAGPIAQLPLRERFHWLVAPRSTLIQISAVHTGLSDDPETTLRDLYRRSVSCS